MTELLEDFDGADANFPLTRDQPWSEPGSGAWQTVSNTARVDSTGTARCDSDLASDDHSVEGVCTFDADSRIGPACRFSDSADTCYFGWVRANASSTYRIYKRVGGVDSLLTTVDTTAAVSGSVIRISVEGTSPPIIKLYDDDVEVASATDSTSPITTGKRGGMWAEIVGMKPTIDDWRAADLEAVIDIAGSSAGSSTVSGALSVSHPLAASSGGVSTTSSSLSIARPLAATSSGTSTVSGALSVVHPLAGTSAGTSTVSGTLPVTHPLAASSAGASTVSGTLTVTTGVPLVATSAGVSTVAASLSIARSLAASSAGNSSVTATLLRNAGLSGSSIGISTASGSMPVTHSLVATSAGSASVAATLTLVTAFVGITQPTHALVDPTIARNDVLVLEPHTGSMVVKATKETLVEIQT